MKTLIGVALVSGILLPGAAWAQATQSSEADRKAGKAVYDSWCATCHGEGRYMAGTNGLRAKYMDTLPALLEQRTDLTAQQVKLFVRRGVGVMAPFRKTEITDKELETLAAYVSRNRQAPAAEPR